MIREDLVMHTRARRLLIPLHGEATESPVSVLAVDDQHGTCLINQRTKASKGCGNYLKNARAN